LPFALLWTLLSPLLIAALKQLLPWLIQRITDDVNAGRPTVITDAQIKAAMNFNREKIKAHYYGD
jgi:hypothetical protein